MDQIPPVNLSIGQGSTSIRPTTNTLPGDNAVNIGTASGPSQSLGSIKNYEIVVLTRDERIARQILGLDTRRADFTKSSP